MIFLNLGICLISTALIAYQLALMRILSFIQWYHFAFMIISLSLLGFGASGVFLSIFRERFIRQFSVFFFLFLFACSVSMILSIQVLRFIPFEPYLLVVDFSQILPLLLVCGLLFLPFVFGAGAIGLAFMYFAERVHQLYFANLFGSAIGGVLALCLMFFIHPTKLIPTIAVIAFFVVFLIWLKLKGKIFTVLVGINFIILVLTIPLAPTYLKMSEYKSLSKAKLLPEAKVVKEKIGPMGVIDVLESPVLRYAPGMSFNFSGDVDIQLGVFSDGEWVGAIFDRRKSERIEFLDYTISSLPYHLKPKGDVLVVGAGTGGEIQLAIQHEASNITGIELNPQIVELIKKDFADIAKNLYNPDISPKITIIEKEARSFLAQTNVCFDIISIPIMEGFVASSAGMYSLFENYLFTIESFKLMFDRLTDDGILAVTTWMNYPPRQAMKMLITIIETLKQKGIKHPEEHFAGVRSWDSAIMFLKKNKFTEEEVECIMRFCDRHSFDPVYYPGITTSYVNRFNQLEHDYLYSASLKLLYEKKDSFCRDYPFFIEPATDNRPYYSHFLKFVKIPHFFKLFGRDALSLVDWGYILLISTLIVLTLLSKVFILLPLSLLGKSNNARGKLKVFIYFSGLGLGFMFIEIVMIQKFILFLGHPIYSVSAVITGILLFSGLGSLFSKRLNASENLRKFICLILVFGLIYCLSLNKIFGFMLHFPVWLKYISSLLIISPQAFFMGMPFPTGLGLLSRVSPPLVPWAWGINGFMSVIGPVLATFFAIEFGFFVVFALAIIFYGVVLTVGAKFI